MLWLWRPHLRRALPLIVRRSAHVSPESTTVTLRPYQESALFACTNALDQGLLRIGVSMPTGTGKTTLFLSLIDRIKAPDSKPSATRALVMVNAIELAQQAAEQAKRMFPNWVVEIEQGDSQASGYADVTMATYQTLLRPGRLDKFDPTKIKAIIVDEAHHAASPSYRKLLSHFNHKVIPPGPEDTPVVHEHNIPIIGVSATFSRHDGLALSSVFEELVYHDDFLTMIKEKWLSEIRFTTVKANLDLKDVKVNSKSGDFNAPSLAQVVNTDAINSLVVATWLDKATDRKSTIIFCVNLAHVSDLTRAFREVGLDARYVHSGTPISERKKLLNSFRQGEFPILINCNILTEGTDIPGVDCIILARPTRSKNLFTQMIGRGMRLSPSKTDCHIIDFVDSMQRVTGVVSVPSLFGLDPSTFIDNHSVEDLQSMPIKSTAKADGDTTSGGKLDLAAPKTVTYIEHENPFAPVDGASGAPHVAAISLNAWVGCGEDIYVLECLGHGFIRIEPIFSWDSLKYPPKAKHGKEKDKKTSNKSVQKPVCYVAHFTPASADKRTTDSLKMSPFYRSKPILTAATLEDAIHGCDTYAAARVVMGIQHIGLKRTAKWRVQPATPAQRALVASRWKSPLLNVSPDQQLERLASLTKGEAANIITRLKHGAQVRYENRVKEQLKQAKWRENEQKRKAKEWVGVGPLPVDKPRSGAINFIN